MRSVPHTPEGGTKIWKEEAVATTVLRGVVGSTAHGVATGDDDRDEMGVCLPGAEWVLSLDAPRHYVHRDAAEGERSKPGDLDLTIYTLRRYIYLLTHKANPTCQVLLWLPEDLLTVVTSVGHRLRRLRHLAVTSRLGMSFLGYMRDQRERLTGERGQKRVKRPELVERYGFDSKYAGHVIRLGLQGVEMARHGRLTLPMPSQEREEVMAVRRGELKLPDVLHRAAELEATLEGLIPAMPRGSEGQSILEEWMVREHLRSWQEADDRPPSGSEPAPPPHA
jgi:predicted nucleotidyltransferase